MFEPFNWALFEYSSVSRSRLNLLLKILWIFRCFQIMYEPVVKIPLDVSHCLSPQQIVIPNESSLIAPDISYEPLLPYFHHSSHVCSSSIIKIMLRFILSPTNEKETLRLISWHVICIQGQNFRSFIFKYPSPWLHEECRCSWNQVKIFK